MKEKAQELINGMISVWVKKGYLKQPAEILRNEAEKIIPEVVRILEQKKKGDRTKCDEARFFIRNFLSEKCSISPRKDHFVKKDGKDIQTIEIILEEKFYDRKTDSLVFKNQNELSMIMIPCLSEKEIPDFFEFFFGNSEKEISRRFKAMLWFSYLLIDAVETDKENVCKKGSDNLKTKLEKLLKFALNEDIMLSDKKIKDLSDKEINKLSDKEIKKYDYDAGIWNETVFALLQGEDRKQFLEYLIERFNFDNKEEHSTRLLLTRHRNCMYQKAVAIFCKERREQ